MHNCKRNYQSHPHMGNHSPIFFILKLAQRKKVLKLSCFKFSILKVFSYHFYCQRSKSNPYCNSSIWCIWIWMGVFFIPIHNLFDYHISFISFVTCVSLNSIFSCSKKYQKNMKVFDKEYGFHFCKNNFHFTQQLSIIPPLLPINIDWNHYFCARRYHLW